MIDANDSPDGAARRAILHTNQGEITLDLFPDQAPKTVANFAGLADGTKEYTQPNAMGESEGPFYDGATFHRVIDGYMIQGGDPTGTGRGGPGYKFDDEFHPDLQFDRPYRLAMVNAGPSTSTNGSQFFITLVPATHLNFKFTVFGEVADEQSREVVDAIGRTATGPGDKPLEDIVINSVTIEQAAAQG